MGTPVLAARWRQFGARRAVLLVTPLASVLAIMLLAQVHLDAYLWLSGEDGLVEWATVVCYLAATAVAVGLVVRWRRLGYPVAAVAYVALCVGFVFIDGEEVSWGQRILGFDGPEALVAQNLQNEANLHNLLGRYALHGAYIAVALWGIGLGRWLARRVPWLRPAYAFAPSASLAWWFVPVLAYYLYVDYVVPLLNAVGVAVGEGPPRLQEPVELVLGAGFLLFVVEVWARSSHERSRDRRRTSRAATT